MKPKQKRFVAKGIFAALSIAFVPINTLIFGLKKSPVEYTLSNIGNFFDYRVNFIIWGVVTGLLLIGFIGFTFRKAQFEHNKAKRYLILSYVFLILTVLTPALRDQMQFWFMVHNVTATLFALFLVASLLFFMHYLSENNKKVYSKSLFSLLFSIGFPVLLLILFGRITGLAEIAFFVFISGFLMLLNIYLNREQRERMPELYKKKEDSSCEKVQ